MNINCGTDENGDPNIVNIQSLGSGGQDVDVTRWGARRINLCIYDVQETIKEGIAAGPIPVFNISGANQTYPNY